MWDEPIARPGQSLQAHLANAAKIASVWAHEIGLQYTGELLGVCHDEGKTSKDFQVYIHSCNDFLDIESEEYVNPRDKKGTIDHSTAGAQRVWRELGHRKTQKQDHLFAQIITLCLVSHHSGLIDCLAPDGNENFFRRINKNEIETHLQEVIARFGKTFGQPDQDLLGASLLEMRERFKTLLRPVKSPLCKSCSLSGVHCRITDPLAWFHMGLMTRMLFSCLIDADRIDSADTEHPENAALRTSENTNWEKLARRLETALAGFTIERSIDKVRAEIAAHCLKRSASPRGLFTLTVPTGGGKTLSALRFALNHAVQHDMSRIIHVIPYTSIIDQNAQVARMTLEQDTERGSIVLEHHSNLEPDKETPRTRLAAECWDAPVIYTTMVQFLECLFSGGTRSARRMHRLANAIIVFDEIQTLPVNCAHLFCNAVNFLIEQCGASVVLCTATQPLLNRLENKDWGVLALGPEREIMPDVEELFSHLERVRIQDQTRPQGWELEEIVDLAISEYNRTGSCLVVVNTKKWARALYEECARRNIIGLFHLSTDMCPAHRLNMLENMRGRLGNAPVLCISTQLIEAGVDISFGSAIRFLAGMDSILQTAGRCNRHGESLCGQVHIVNPAHESLGMLQEIKKGQEATRRVLSEFRDAPDSLGGSLLRPAVIERYFKYYFFERRGDMTYPVKGDNAGHDDTLLNMLSCNPRNAGNVTFQPGLRQSFATAGKLFSVIDAPTKGIIVPYGEGKEIIAELCSALGPYQLRHLLRKAQRFSVNVFPNMLEKLSQTHAIHQTQEGSGIFYLDQQNYSMTTGISSEVAEAMELLIS
ncbi:CRISPR-associated helicase Cas3' [Desulfocurvibacter africanus]|uniref:CRISPR-associated helicase Cas3' n=1 Tax=Desulfocurvibacter africanus TaxID=873 RepID=UPI002FD9ED5A